MNGGPERGWTRGGATVERRRSDGKNEKREKIQEAGSRGRRARKGDRDILFFAPPCLKSRLRLKRTGLRSEMNFVSFVDEIVSGSRGIDLVIELKKSGFARNYRLDELPEATVAPKEYTG